jgi:glycosyltransferase involved in cell wall biosynthesis
MSKEEPTLSFCIPVYKKNPEVFERCLESLFDMSFKDIEVICVFDGPDAELEAVAKRFKKVQSFVIEHGGAPKARNEAFKHSKGRSTSPFGTRTVTRNQKWPRCGFGPSNGNPGAAFVYSGYEWSREGMDPVNAEPFDLHSLQSGNYIASMFPVERKFVVNWDESLKGAQDWDFWLTVAENGGKGVFIQGYGFITEPSNGRKHFLGRLEFWKPGRNDSHRA